MKKSVKAALCSALVCPGAGHFILKRYARGLLLLVPSLAAVIFIGNHAMQMASSIADKIMSGDAAPDAQTLSTMLEGASDGSALMISVATWVLALCWIVGVIDSWRIGRNEDVADANNPKS